MPCASPLFLMVDHTAGRGWGKKWSVNVTEGRKHSTGGGGIVIERWLTVTIHTNDCRALLLGQINYLSLWVVVLRRRLILLLPLVRTRPHCISPRSGNVHTQMSKELRLHFIFFACFQFVCWGFTVTFGENHTCICLHAYIMGTCPPYRTVQ